MVNERQVTVYDMADARDARALAQRQMLAEFGVPLVSLSMNIAGPVKSTRAIEYAFDRALFEVHAQLAALGGALEQRVERLFTGSQALFAVDSSALKIKKSMCWIEENTPLGRLFDIDVLDSDGQKIDRTQLGLPVRRCLICGEQASVCARSRAHSVEELLARTNAMIENFAHERYADFIASTAQRALLYEVATTPKPGLVDCRNSGSHKDMDMFTFVDSACVLTPYFAACTRAGITYKNKSPHDCFEAIRPLGIQAEAHMSKATGGVNTHKGAIFTLGILCAALGMSFTVYETGDLLDVFKLCADMTSTSLAQDLADVSEQNARTFGERMYALYGLPGVRGEVAGGLKSIREISLPLLKKLTDEGMRLQDAGMRVLLALMAQVYDSNTIRRAGMEEQQWLMEEAKSLCNAAGETAEIERLDDVLIRKNISPGGCADLLAVTYFCYFLLQEEELHHVTLSGN